MNRIVDKQRQMIHCKQARRRLSLMELMEDFKRSRKHSYGWKRLWLSISTRARSSRSAEMFSEMCVLSTDFLFEFCMFLSSDMEWIASTDSQYFWKSLHNYCSCSCQCCAQNIANDQSSRRAQSISVA
jgi:hypothetical protein